jgi:hypothetical protein
LEIAKINIVPVLHYIKMNVSHVLTVVTHLLHKNVLKSL